MIKLILSTTILSIASTAVLAETYQGEIGIGYSDIEIDTDLRKNNFDATTLQGKIYFSEVDMSKGPLAEAAFLNHASGIEFNHLNIATDDSSNNGERINIRYVMDNDIILRASHVDFEDEKAFEIGVGYYLNNNTDIVLSYKEDANSDAVFNSPDIFTATSTFDSARIYNIKMHTLSPLAGNKSIAWDLGLSHIEAESLIENTVSGYDIKGGVNYYLNDNLSIGGSLGYYDMDSVDRTHIGLKADYFITPKVRATLSYDRNKRRVFNTGVSPDHQYIDAFNLALSMRF